MPCSSLSLNVTMQANTFWSFSTLEYLGLQTMVRDPKVSNRKLDGYEIDCGMMSEGGPL